MHNRHCFLIAALIAATLAGLAAPPAVAQTTINIGNPSASGAGYTFANNVLTIDSAGSYTITGTTAENRVVIAANVVATVTLRDASITSAVASPFKLDSASANVTLRLEGDNTLTNTITSDIGLYYAGLKVESSAILTITGSGTLTATGGAGGSGGNITISDGNIIADEIGVGNNALTPVNISGDSTVIITGDINVAAGDYNGAKVQTGVSLLSLEMLQLMAANAAAALQDTARVTPIVHDTTHIPVADTLHTTVELHDTTRIPTPP